MQNKITSREVFYDDFTGEEYYSNQDANISVFSKEELQTIDHVLSIFGRLSATQISEISHREEGYKETRHLDFIPYSFAEKLSI